MSERKFTSHRPAVCWRKPPKIATSVDKSKQQQIFLMIFHKQSLKGHPEVCFGQVENIINFQRRKLLLEKTKDTEG